jgi:hypothetical protein
MTHTSRLAMTALALITAGGVAWADEPTPTPPDEKPKPTIDAPGDQSTRPQVGPTTPVNTQERTSEPILERPAIPSPVTRKEITRPTMDKSLIDTYLRSWPERASKAARATISAYGLPNEATSSMFFWIENGPWYRTIVYKDELVHDFPRSHYDVIENVIQLKVPLSKVDDVLGFEGSVTVKRTEGLVSVRGNSEAMNFLAMNLVNDIVTGKKTTAQARKAYARGAMAIAKAEPPEAATKLLFRPSDDRAQDPDRAMLKGEFAEPGEKLDEPAAPPAPPLPSPNDIRPTPARPDTRPNDLNKPPPPAPTPVPGTKNGPTTGKR